MILTMAVAAANTAAPPRKLCFLFVLPICKAFSPFTFRNKATGNRQQATGPPLGLPVLPVISRLKGSSFKTKLYFCFQALQESDQKLLRFMKQSNDLCRVILREILKIFA